MHSIFVESLKSKMENQLFFFMVVRGGISSTYRQYFNPEKWRIIMFDQRGCGKTPFAGA